MINVSEIYSDKYDDGGYEVCVNNFPTNDDHIDIRLCSNSDLRFDNDVVSNINLNTVRLYKRTLCERKLIGKKTLIIKNIVYTHDPSYRPDTTLNKVEELEALLKRYEYIIKSFDPNYPIDGYIKSEIKIDKKEKEKDEWQDLFIL